MRVSRKERIKELLTPKTKEKFFVTFRSPYGPEEMFTNNASWIEPNPICARLIESVINFLRENKIAFSVEKAWSGSIYIKIGEKKIRFADHPFCYGEDKTIINIVDNPRGYRRYQKNSDGKYEEHWVCTPTNKKKNIYSLARPKVVEEEIKRRIAAL